MSSAMIKGLERLEKLSKAINAWFQAKVIIALSFLYGLSYVGIGEIEQRIQSQFPLPDMKLGFSSNDFNQFIQPPQVKGWYPYYLVLSSTLAILTLVFISFTISFFAYMLLYQQNRLEYLQGKTQTEFGVKPTVRPALLKITFLNVLPIGVMLIDLLQTLILTFCTMGIPLQEWASTLTYSKWISLRMVVSGSTLSLLLVSLIHLGVYPSRNQVHVITKDSTSTTSWPYARQGPQET